MHTKVKGVLEALLQQFQAGGISTLAGVSTCSWT